MKRVTLLAARLYPRAWKRRYSVEYEALLDALSSQWNTLFDVVQGALFMQVKMHMTYLKVAVAAGVTGAILAAGLSFHNPGHYVSSGVVTFASGGKPSSEMELAEQRTLSTMSLSQTIQTLDLYHRERVQKPLLEIIFEMRKDIHVTRLDSRSIGFSFSYPDAAKATAGSGPLARKFAAETVDLQPVQIRVNVPDVAIPPNRLIYAAWGMAAGCVIGLLAMALLRRPKFTLGVLGFSLMGCALAFAISFLFPARYISRATVFIHDPAAAQRAREVLSSTNLALILQDSGVPSDRVQARDISVQPLAGILGDQSTPAGLEMSFACSDRFKAQAVVRTITDRLALSSEMLRDARKSSHWPPRPNDPEFLVKWRPAVETIDAASLPETNLAAYHSLLSIVGLCFGFLLGTRILRSRLAANLLYHALCRRLSSIISIRLLTLFAIVSAACAQLTFDVASFKQVAEFQTGTASEKIIVHPGSLTMRSVRLRACIMWAYDVKDYQISGPR